MNPNSRYEEANILLELKQARVNLRRQASDEGHQVKKSQVSEHKALAYTIVLYLWKQYKYLIGL